LAKLSLILSRFWQQPEEWTLLHRAAARTLGSLLPFAAPGTDGCGQTANTSGGKLSFAAEAVTSQLDLKS
jgi:hypothetical protein